ncbi:MAG: DUF1361 domain-containing protein [Flavobacteriales bacterium]|nr:DUF1361 domain-containing protein [Flavobacteriales bacterium]
MMKTILQLIHLNKRINYTILALSVYCFGLLIVRAKATQSVYLFFLIWNLVLAVIPYLISSFATLHFSKFKNWHMGIIVLMWITFLPNSFYIITDLVHVVKSSGNLFYYDLILISSFAITGFFLGLSSLIQIEQVVEKLNFKPRTIHYSLLLICLLNGFGIYIGRVLRFNSWDIISNPIDLFSTLCSELLTKETILFSLHFGMFIYLILLLYKNTISNSLKNDTRTI